MDAKKLEKYYYECLLIRKTEQCIEELFSKGKIFGTTHGSIGEEIIAAAVLSKIDIKKDSVTGTHRSHGHFLALFHDPKALLCELMGKKDGVVSGKGGSQHLCREHFYTNGITGGMVPVATGIALTEKLSERNNIVIAFLGDGAMNEGYVMESFNFSGVKELPILYVLENNQYAMSTSVKQAASGDFCNRVNAFNIKTFRCEAANIEMVESVSDEAIEYVRKYKKPAFIEFDTYRFCGHSKSDRCEYRTKEEEKCWLEKDPVLQLKKKVEVNICQEIEGEIHHMLSQAVLEAEQSQWPDPIEIYGE